MDARAEMALAERVRATMAADLDELYVRVEALERNAASAVPERREYVERRERRRPVR